MNSKSNRKLDCVLTLFAFTLAASLIVESVYALDEMQRHAVKTTEVSGSNEAICMPDSLSASNSGFTIPVLTKDESMFSSNAATAICRTR